MAEDRRNNASGNFDANGDVLPEAMERWQEVQIRTFTRWVNMYLSQRGMELKNFKTDFADGFMFSGLVEQLSGAQLPRLKKSEMRIAKINNVGQVFTFLTSKESVKFVNTSAEDVVDGNLRIILGLVWTLIQRYQFTLPDAHNKAHSDDKKARSGIESTILAWVNQQLREYPDAPNVNNFSSSWQDGKALARLADSLKPGCVNLAELNGENVQEDIDLAMRVSEEHFGVPRLLDAADMADNPEPHSVLTYVSYFWRYAQDSQQRLANGGADHDRCLVSPEVYKAGKGQPTTFKITACNSQGQALEKGGDVFKVLVTADADQSTMIANVIDNNNGTYSCTWIPHHMGKHTVAVQLQVKLMGRPIQLPVQGSPFQCEVGEDVAAAALADEVARMQALLAKYQAAEAEQGARALEIALAAVARAEAAAKSAEGWNANVLTVIDELNEQSSMDDAHRVKEQALKATFEAEQAAKDGRAAATEAEATGLKEQSDAAKAFAARADAAAEEARRRAADAQARADAILLSWQSLYAAQRHADLAHQASQSAAQDSAAVVVARSLELAEQSCASCTRHAAVCEEHAEKCDEAAGKCLEVHKEEARRWNEQAQRAVDSARSAARTAQQVLEQKRAAYAAASVELNKAEAYADETQVAADAAQQCAGKAADPAISIAQAEAEALLARDHAAAARQQCRLATESADRVTEYNLGDLTDLAIAARERAEAAAQSAESAASSAEAVARSRAEADVSAARERDLIERKPPTRLADGSFIMGDRLPVFTPNGSVSLGVVKVSVRYDSEAQRLKVVVYEARALESQSKGKNTADPYIKFYIQPDPLKESKRKTGIKKKTLDPVYNERFEFNLQQSDLATRSLELCVWHNKGFRQNVFMGQVEFDLRAVPVDVDEVKAVTWLALQPKAQGAHRLSGSIRDDDGIIRYPDGSKRLLDGSFVLKDGSTVPPWGPNPQLPVGASMLSDDCVLLEDTTVRLPSGAICRSDGLLRETDGNIAQPLWKIPSAMLPKDVVQRPDYRFALQDQIVVEQRMSNTACKFGLMKLAISYHSASQRLHCGIYEARGLPKNFNGVAPTAFCQLMVLPDSRYPDCRQKTAAVRRSVDPEWNQLISFDVAQDNLATQYLELSLMDQQFSKSTIIGQLVIDLKSVQVDADESQVTWWYALRPTSSAYEERRKADVREAVKANDLVETARREQAEAQRTGQQKLNALTQQIAALDRNLVESIQRAEGEAKRPNADPQTVDELRRNVSRLQREKEDLLAQFDLQHKEMELKEEQARERLREQDVMVMDQRLAAAKRRTRNAEADLVANPEDEERVLYVQDCKDQEAVAAQNLVEAQQMVVKSKETQVELAARIQELLAKKEAREAEIAEEFKMARSSSLNAFPSSGQIAAAQEEEEDDSDDEEAPMAAMPTDA